MQWPFVLVGFLIGAVLGKTVFSACAFGALGFLLAQYQELQKRLLELNREFQQLTKRLIALEKNPPTNTADVAAQQNKIAAPEKIVAPENSDTARDLSLDAAPIDTPLIDTSERPARVPLAERLGTVETAPITPAETAIENTAAVENKTIAHAESTARVTAVREPRKPSLFVRAFQIARDWLLGGNTVLRVGVVLLFLGLAFLLRYASERVVLPVEFRYLGVAITAIVLLALGWRLRHRNHAYGLMLQGAGIAVLYLTVFAALRLQPLLTATQAFSLLIAVTICSAILAITQDALALAAAAALGGFAAPILASTGSGNHVALFSYFALLNCGIFAIAWFKAWRTLNVIGFIGTFGIGFAWGMRSYQPELFNSTEPFLIFSSCFMSPSAGCFRSVNYARPKQRRQWKKTRCCNGRRDKPIISTAPLCSARRCWVSVFNTR